MLYRDFTKPELEHCIDICNFTDSELQYFLLRAKDYTNVKISLEMNVSERQVSKLAQRVKNKVNRINVR